MLAMTNFLDLLHVFLELVTWSGTRRGNKVRPDNDGNSPLIYEIDLGEPI